ncbi:MAG: FAD-dependent oxidoreductase [Actinomycetota bacterium]
MFRRVGRRDFVKGSVAAAVAAGLARRAPATPNGVPDPDGWLITRWAADPFALGSYSFLPPGATPDDRATLAEPVGRVLFFAGEATSVDYPATVHGAYLSGRRAASEVAEEAGTGARVVVIGAGVAGLAAGRALQREGYDVVVVEGRDRIGGRVWTDRSLGAPLDLGASWIHESDGNPITELARKAGAATAVTDYDNAVAYEANGRPLSGRAQAAYDDLLREVLRDAAALGEALDADTSLQRGIDGVVADLELDTADRVGLEYALNVEIEHDYAADAAELSLWWWDEGESLAGDDLVFPRNGYGRVARYLAADLDVLLSHVVERIEYGDGVTVVTDQGPVPAEHVVVTLPLGVLQAGRVGFVPELPQPKRIAIGRLGMGLLDKVYLRFAEVFWDDDVEFIGRVGPKGEWADWLNIAFYTDEPVLMAFNAGSFARSVEQLSDDQVVAAALAVLRRIYG